MEPQKLININAFSLDRVLEMDPEFMDTEGEHQHDQRVSFLACFFLGTLSTPGVKTRTFSVAQHGSWLMAQVPSASSSTVSSM